MRQGDSSFVAHLESQENKMGQFPYTHKMEQETSSIAAGTILDTFNYVYDNKGRITSVTSNAGTTTYVYDELDQLKKETHLTMTVTPSGGTATTTTYHYDNANEITDVNGTNTRMMPMVISQMMATKPMSMTMVTDLQW